MKAMILAAGAGTRLRPLTVTMPKPMVPLANTPLLVRTLRLLRTQGITDIAINLHHRPNAIRTALGDGSALGVDLRYSDETALMGTAGGVKRMERFLDEPFLVLYGDNLYQADFAPLIAFHRERRGIATLATFEAPDPSACGLVVTDPDGRVTRFQEKPPPEDVFTNQANAGVYILDPEVFSYIPENAVYDFGRDVFPALLARRPGTMLARPLGGYLQDTGTIDTYRQANWDLIEGRVAGNAPESGISPTALVARDALIVGRTILGPGIVVGDGARVRESIVWEDTVIGSGAYVDGAILGRGVTVGAGATISQNAIAADGAIIDPGAEVRAGARIQPGERVTTNS